MQNVITEVETAAKRPGFITATRVRIAGVLATVAALVIGTVSPSFAATPSDPTGGMASTIQTDLSGWVTSYGLPLLIALLVLGLTIAVGLKYARKGARAL
jgi:hypothetical protein